MSGHDEKISVTKKLRVTNDAQLGEGASDVVGFYGTTPIAQQSGLSGVLVGVLIQKLIDIGLVAA